ncbi:phage tail assembly chaperone [Limnobaculum xujianqingii]|uniref:phage tail assembly chaperone n=1 Tax=Limnobaculum xujianqingii TaxID=2738837 RepID=UPI00112A9DB2|nr:phage tail assembly chaperone [Limnobaculum xujianqingii]
MAKKSLKSLALSPLSGFRHMETDVPEWEGAKVILREPSGEAWLRWREIVKEEGEDKLSLPEKALRDVRADVTLFVDVLCDERYQRVFTVEDTEEVVAHYGPVHSRLLKQALELITSADAIKKK